MLFVRQVVDGTCGIRVGIDGKTCSEILLRSFRISLAWFYAFMLIRCDALPFAGPAVRPLVARMLC